MIHEHYFEDYVIGATHRTFGRTVTESDILVHAGHTGDFFPHHVDAVWCAAQPFGQRIAHGTLVFSIGIGLTATRINPRAMSYGYDKLRFLQPVFIGDTITTHTEILEKRPHPKRSSRGVVVEQVHVRNQSDQTVLACQHLYLVERRSA